MSMPPISWSADVCYFGLVRPGESRPVRRLARPGAQPELHRRQGQPRAHHQAR
jgi:hypothetical protein